MEAVGQSLCSLCAPKLEAVLMLAKERQELQHQRFISIRLTEALPSLTIGTFHMYFSVGVLIFHRLVL